MMDSLRTAANSLVLKIIFGIIIVSFILTGVSGYLIGGGNNYAAKVNDQKISRGQFENAFNSVIACSNSWAINTPSWQRTKAI